MADVTPPLAQQHLDPHDTRKRIFAIVGASSGNLVECSIFTSIRSAHSILLLRFSPAVIPRRNSCKPLAYLPSGF